MSGGRVEQPMDAVGAEDVRDLVRVGDDGGRPERQHEARELVRKELRRLEVHVRVDEARHDVPPARVHDLGAVVLAEAGDPAVRNRDVDVEPFPREHRKHPAAAHDDVRRLVAAGDGKASGEVQGHRLASDCKRRAEGRPRDRPSSLVTAEPSGGALPLHALGGVAFAKRSRVVVLAYEIALDRVVRDESRDPRCC